MILSIVIPAFNEEGNIRAVYDRLKGVLADCVEDFELFYVDDGSSDGTSRIVEDLHREDGRVGLITLSRNFGHQVALMAGCDRCRGDAVVALDADLQHPPEMIPRMIEQWKAGAMIVQTVRNDGDSVGLGKKVGSWVFYSLFRKFTGLALETGAADFFLIDRTVLLALNDCRDATRFTRGLLTWFGYKRVLLPYTADKRHSGTTKYSITKMMRFALDGILAFSSAPLRMIGGIGVFSTLLSLVYLAYTIYIRIFSKVAAPGWASVVTVVTFFGGVQLVMLWLLGEYLARLVDLSRRRPIYLTSRVLETRMLTDGSEKRPDTRQPSEGAKC